MQLLDINEVMARTKKRRTKIYADIRTGNFPKPIKDGASSRWVDTEVDQYLQSLIALRDKAAA
jgi:prophage regulatory protein